MLLAQNAIRDELKEKVEAGCSEREQATDEVKAACKEYWIPSRYRC